MHFLTLVYHHSGNRNPFKGFFLIMADFHTLEQSRQTNRNTFGFLTILALIALHLNCLG